MKQRILLISPVRNEVAHFECVARAVAAQTQPPAAWVVVDDGSDDGTLDLVESLAREIDFMTVVRAPPSPPGGRDRLARAAAPRAFNVGLRAGNDDTFTHIGKLDGDIELPPDYFERLLGQFEQDPLLGLAGGQLIEPFGSGWKRISIPDTHVHGAVKLYSRACFTAIGGVREQLGWDTIDGIYARMRGFTTRSFPQILARHHRHWGSADGTLRGRARHGRCAYITHYGILWVTLRALKLARTRPYGLSGIAFLYGYLSARARSVPRVADAEFRRFVKRDLRRRMLKPLSSRLPQYA